MNPDILEKVLSCSRLPSLPAVAARILELAADPETSARQLAAEVQHDQALAAKLLRTANSAFYGLGKPCSTLNQVAVVLGVHGVKTLALGFSLVSALDPEAGGTFDYESYWRRALYTGIGARSLARRAGLAKAEECFLGGLLQDVGMIALHQALGESYDELVRRAGADHRALPNLEVAVLEVHHADIGALLGRRWKLPEELVMPIKYHERPTAAPAAHTGIVRCVGLGNIASDVLTAAEPAGPLTRFFSRAEQWFGLTREQAEDVLREVTSAATEVAALLQISTGALADAGQVLRLAQQRLLSLTRPARASGPAPAIPEPVQLGAAEFQLVLADRLQGALTRGETVSVALAELRPGTDGPGQAAPDLAAFDRVARAIAQIIAPNAGLVGTLSATRLGLLLPGADRLAAARLCELARTRGGLAAQDPDGAPASRGTVPHLALGLVTLDAATAAQLGSLPRLLAACEQAMMAPHGSAGTSVGPSKAAA
ncbi:MAG TPA: HDOD domain-containing protein [Phycisphaerales bacterium]|nr:HDOD domain-containing protein [Phycisphaerales bacterium]